MSSMSSKSSRNAHSRAACSLALLAVLAAACGDQTATAPRATPRAAPPVRSIADLPPVPIDDFWFSTPTVVAGRLAWASIQFGRPVPAGGGRIVISTDWNWRSRKWWALPDSVFDLAPGSTSLQFPVDTDTSSTQLHAEFTAKQGSYWVSNIRGFDVTPSPSVGFSPTSLTFPGLAVGTTSATQTIVVRSLGNAPLALRAPTITAPFAQRNDCPATLPVGGQCTYTVWYAPTSAGSHTGTLRIPNDAPIGPQWVDLNGSAFVPTPALSVTPSSLGFGSVAVGLTTSGRIVKITSTGTAPLVVSDVSLGGANAWDFWLGNDGCTGKSLSPGASCTFAVSFEPTAVGTRTATAIVTHNAPGGPAVVSLSGAGLKSGGGGYIP
jgi:hypothetical protein